MNFVSNLLNGALKRLSLKDIEGLKQLGISSAIVGKSLYNGSLKLEDVLAVGEEDDQ